ncbi:MAG TPA: tetratricopeptide repeat protein, partial [Verrucomicrobiae bacterium]|nr:tetratricopeptide repeat protein [Verrucomicrobiae bacterium]
MAGATLLSGCTVRSKIERYTKRGDAYFSQADYEKARLEYLNAFRLDQNDAYVAGRLGESLLEKGDVEHGFPLLWRARELQPTNIVLRYKIGSILLMAGEVAKARQESEDILKQSPLDSEGIILLANSAIGTNEIAATRTRLETLLPAANSNPAVHLALGILAQKSANLPAAQAEYEKAATLDPKSSRYSFALANIYFAQGNTNKADLYFKSASENSALKSVERLGYSEFLLKSGRIEEAKKLLQESVTKTPNFFAGWNALAQIAFKEKDTNAVAQFIGKVLAQDPGNREALLNSARLKLTTRDYSGAIAELQQLADRHPRDSHVQYQLAVAYAGSDNPLKAFPALDKAINLNTNNVDAALLRAQLRISRGDLNTAIPELLRVI